MQHARQRVAVALAARQHADPLEHIVVRKQEASQQTAQLRLRGRGATTLQIVDHRASGSSALY